MKGKKCLTLLVLSLSFVFSWLFISSFFTSNASAASIGTYSFGLRYRTNNGNYQYAGDLRFGRSDGVTIVFGGANKYNFYTSTITPTGSFSVIHFETNMVVSTDDIQYVFGYWDNLGELSIENVYFNDVNYTSSIVSSTVSTAITDWDQWINGVHYYNSTLTVYGDVVVNNIPTGSEGRFRFIVGSENDFYVNNTDNPDLLYFEQNPTTIEFTQDINNALLQTQINQNTTIINNQNELNDWLKDNTPPDVDTSVISGASGWLPQGPVDSLLTLPMTFAQGIVEIFTGQHQCSPIVLPFDFINSSITIPCLDTFFNMSGVNLIWNGVGTIISAFVLYDTFKWLYKFVDDTLTFRENNSGLWGGL